MIILRQKLYSSLLAKTLYKTGKLKNRLTTLPARLTKDLHSGGLFKDLGKRATADSRIQAGTKSNTQLKREAIQGDRKLRSSILEAVNSSTTKEGVVDYAGKSAGNFVELASENPITATTGAVAYGTLAKGIMLPPGLTEAAMGFESGMKKAIPAYGKLTNKTKQIAEKRRWKDKAGGVVRSVLVPVM